MHSRKIKDRSLFHILTSPVIYSLIVPFLVIDIWVEIYHRVCFTAYRIPYVSRSKYIRIDRHKLAYLNPFEKLNCMYCGYINGLVHYVSVIAGETEKYWCGIRHKADPEFIEPAHHRDFLPYGDEEAFRNF